MKNKILNGVWSLGILLALLSCGNSKKEPQVTPVVHDEAVAKPANGNLDEVSEISEVRFKDEAIKNVYTAYLEVKTALVNTNAAEVTKKSTALVTQLKAANASDEAMVAATAMASNSEVEKQREAFGVLSAATEKMLKGTITSGEVYKQFCPMAFNGKGGYWLSNSKEIRNPYFGDKMLKCGMIQETFK